MTQNSNVAVPYRRSEVQHSHASASRQPSAQRNVHAFTAPCRALFGLATFFTCGVYYRVLDCLSWKLGLLPTLLKETIYMCRKLGEACVLIYLCVRVDILCFLNELRTLHTLRD
ncbi:unnamed protein product [Acanthoscelides obtectus]|uniref:Uncharacterized protein n=1 Tax=Acanthoscelides obtectus TaxID=200917 RepID=A0A9P0ME50_ACAOB|nr:unnamed protein product [Acanthoscelides obtectus]CAK1659546.1 hypothetical protein AOBTE_LOCUS21524 [Acanthoscelides obtectus]